jgi:hypothetical protein
MLVFLLIDVSVFVRWKNRGICCSVSTKKYKNLKQRIVSTISVSEYKSIFCLDQVQRYVN